MLLLPLRLLVCMALFCLPVLLFVIASRKPENALYLMFPMFGAIPATLTALLVFAPLEATLDARDLGSWKMWAVPMAGSLIIFAVALGFGAATGRLTRMAAALRDRRSTVLAPFVLWSVLGGLWGLLWRFSDGLLARTPLA